MIYWTQFTHGGRQVTIAATEQGACYVGMAENSLQQLHDYVSKKFTDSEIAYTPDGLSIYVDELKRFLDGGLSKFEIPIDLKGTPFQLTVWEALRQIPYGRTATYSDVAQSIGRSDAVRAVASAIGKNPVLLAVPCHRVIAKDGSLAGFRDGFDVKEMLISLEKANVDNFGFYDRL